MAGTAADNVGVTQVSVGERPWGERDGERDDELDGGRGSGCRPGANVVTVTARDAAGNTGTATLTVTYDPTAPTVAITSPTTGGTYTASTSPLTWGGRRGTTSG